MNLMVFHLAAGCGLRRSEIAGLRVSDVTGGSRPVIRVRREIAKGKKKSRTIPLWWDSRMSADILGWCAALPPDAPVIYRRRQGTFLPVDPRRIYDCWRRAIRCLGPERVKQLGVHCGRHTFISHALHVGHTLVQVREAAGHTNLQTTSIYAHLVDGDEGVPDLYGETK